MTIHILMFASLAEQLQVQRVTLTLSDNATVGDAFEELKSRWPKLDALRDRLAVAVNHAYVSEDHVLVDGDEMALIPPVSGG